MNHTEEQFFALLRTGLWHTPIDTALFSEETHWDIILKMATMQTVSGVLFDGASTLPTDQQPATALMRKLYQTTLRIEQSHKVLNTAIEQIVPALQREGIRSILFKGQGVAQNYPNPLRRQCGDIDLYVGQKNCKKAMDILISIGAKPENKTKKISPKHENFDYAGVSLELHFRAEKLRNPLANPDFQRWTQKHLWAEELQVWKNNEVDVHLPPINFDALYIFNHAFHHFIAGGISLRQLCDWMLYLHKFKDRIDKDELLTDLKTLGMLKPWQTFGCILVHQLGLPQEEFPFYNPEYTKASEVVLNKILQVGNFGFYNSEHSKHPSGFLRGKWHSLYVEQRWLSDMFFIFPKDILFFYINYWRSGIINIIKGR